MDITERQHGTLRSQQIRTPARGRKEAGGVFEKTKVPGNETGNTSKSVTDPDLFFEV